MSPREAPLFPALESALAELRTGSLRFEVFARRGNSTQVRRDMAGTWERREAQEVGVACRVAGTGGSGFAAVSGHAALAGREAARAARTRMTPGPDPIPPGERLGRSLAPDPPEQVPLERQEDLARRLAGALDRDPALVKAAEIRLLQGGGESVLINGDGFAGRAATAAASLEVLMAPAEGPWRLVRLAMGGLGDLEPEALADQIREAVLLAVRGGPPSRRLARVLLAPAVAAPLVEALAWFVLMDRNPGTTGEVSPAWRLADERRGPAGLLAMPFDGEGFPARPLSLLDEGTVGERAVVWRQACRGEGAPGGAARPSYRRPPVTAPANLVVHRREALPGDRLLEALGTGVFLGLPAGPVHLDGGGRRFRMLAAGVSLRGGRPVATHPMLELRGSFRGLLRGLLATGTDERSVSLDCAVTTPSLLVQHLEVV